MGKSPGKWIRTLLFSKKSGRSRSTKGKDASNAASDKGYVKGKESASAENSPVISEPVLVTSHSNETASTLAKGTPSSLGGDGVVPAISQDVDKQGIAGSDALEYREKMREEQAAIKAQAAFRGYLARRAFHALKGIIRLQALIRGHLVRRQAATTLHAMQAIVKLQALVRGRIVRRSGVSLEVSVKFWQQKDVNTLDIWKDTLSKNSFIYKLLSSPVGKPLLIQYDRGDANSVFIWLERWTVSHFWKPISQPKKIDAKSQTRRGSYAMETESGKSKRSVRRNPAATVDPGQTNINSESEYPMETESGKSKRSVRRNPAVTVDPGQTNINSESEYPMEIESGKSKRSVRRNPAVTVDPGQININSEYECPMETESGKSKRSVRRNTTMTVDPGQTNINSEPEKAKRSSRKVSSPPDGTIQEHPQTELEKVKRNLRKVSKSIVESSDNKEVGSEKPSNIVQIVAGSISVSPQQSKDDNLKTKKDATLTPDKSDLEASLESVVAEWPTDTPTNMSPGVAEGQIDALTNASPAVAEGQIDALTNASPAVAEGDIDALTNANTGTELQPLQSTDNKENVLVVNSELCSKEERSSAEGHKTSRRRSSFSAKLENGENGLQNSPSIPSYMASTQSAKAKLRGQISPRLLSDSVEKNSFTRRHSLPSSTSGKLSSQSPRTQRHVQVSGRSGVKGDRSLTSSRDGNDRAIQVEWRR